MSCAGTRGYYVNGNDTKSQIPKDMSDCVTAQDFHFVVPKWKSAQLVIKHANNFLLHMKIRSRKINFFALRNIPPAGQDLLLIEVSRSPSNTR